MPSSIRDETSAAPGITKFTNCRLVRNGRLLEQDLWIDAVSGKILRSQEAFYEHQTSADQVIDLGGRIIAPGFIDVQLNGAQGFDFSVPQTPANYQNGLRKVNKGLIKTGVTSYLPTVTSNRREVYQKVLPHLHPSGGFRCPEDGAESLGAHVEGPFLNPARNGIHSLDVLIPSRNGFEDLEACYGAENLRPSTKSSRSSRLHDSPIKMITAAPEVGRMQSSISEIESRGIIFSIGHSDATYEEALEAVDEGATMITHLFNAMRPFGHRNPGIFGLLGQTERPRPYFGIIADGIHLHPTSIKIAFNAHAEGLILVTDAMKLAGLPDGVYDWTNGDRIIKNGALLTLEGSEKIAGSSITLIGCVNNFLRWTDANIPEAIGTVTSTPAAMLGLEGIKGSLDSDADADIVILDEDLDSSGATKFTVEQVWKFGSKVFDAYEA